MSDHDQQQFVMPDFMARAIEAQGRIPVAAVETQVREIERRDWNLRISTGEPTLEEALSSRELFQRHIAPYAREVTS